MHKKHTVKKKTSEIDFRKNAERERAEEALQESESKYRLLIEHSSDLIWNLDLQGVFTYASPSWERITGYPPSAVIGTSFQKIVHSDFFSSFPQSIQQIIQTQSSMSFPGYQVLHADSTWHWHAAAVSPVMGKKGELISVVGVSRDITEQKLAEETIRMNETRLRRAELASNRGIGNFTSVRERSLLLRALLRYMALAKKRWTIMRSEVSRCHSTVPCWMGH